MYYKHNCYKHYYYKYEYLLYMSIECRVNMCKGPVTWRIFNARVEFSPADWVDIFLQSYGQFQPQG